MKCDRYQQLMSEWIDQELLDTLAPPLFRHLSKCADCRDFFTRLVYLRESLQTIPTPQAPAALDKKVLRGHRKIFSLAQGIWRQHAEIPPRRLALSFPAAIAAALILVLFSTFFSIGILRWSGLDRSEEPHYVYIMELEPIVVTGIHSNVRTN